MKKATVSLALQKCQQQDEVLSASTFLKREEQDMVDAKGLKRQITNFAEIPSKDVKDTRIVSYNITVDYFDAKDTTKDKHHQWQSRASVAKKLLGKLAPDIICLQELSPNQALELAKDLGKEYCSIFLSQTPSQIEAGSIVYGEDAAAWTNKFTGTPLIGMFISKSWHFKNVGKFWLKEQPFSIPEHQDRGTSDKGFGNMNTYRAVLWASIKNNEDKVLFIFNSHYPLSGDNETRLKCAKLEMEQIELIAQESPWVSAGDRNLVPTSTDTKEANPETVYRELIKKGYDIRDANKHYGSSSTWIGFSYDDYKRPVEPETVEEHIVLDVMVSNYIPKCSFCHPGMFSPQDNDLMPLSEYHCELAKQCEEDRCFASDHTLIGADFNFDSC